MAPRLSPHLRGHLLWFDVRPARIVPVRAVRWLLVVAVLLEAARVMALAWLPTVPRLALPLPLLVLALLALHLLDSDRSSPGWLGPRRWSEWSLVERSYLVQVVFIAAVVFLALFATGLRARASEAGFVGFAVIFLAYLLYGFYQELVYRGMVQTALVGRWGAVAGVLVANVLFTFGPLHWDHVGAGSAPDWPMLAAIFAIGLLFGAIYQRSGNLWLVATMHAVGNAFIISGLA